MRPHIETMDESSAACWRFVARKHHLGVHCVPNLKPGSKAMDRYGPLGRRSSAYRFSSLGFPLMWYPPAFLEPTSSTQSLMFLLITFLTESSETALPDFAISWHIPLTLIRGVPPDDPKHLHAQAVYLASLVIHIGKDGHEEVLAAMEFGLRGKAL